jgi:bacteriocin biosynthesis cyclodehydratase domain-containing protein
LKGKAVYTWLERLAPHLDGRASLADLTYGLPADKQDMVHGLVAILHERGVIRDIEADLAHGLSADELEVYAQEIAFADSFVGSGAHHFERFREQRLLLIGSGLTLSAAVYAGLRFGVRCIATMVTSEATVDRARHRDYLQHFSARDPRLELTDVPSVDWRSAADIRGGIAPYDIVVHCSDLPMLGRAGMLNCARTERGMLVQAIVTDGVAWIGPLMAGREIGCWECAWRSLASNLEGDSGLKSPLFIDHPWVDPGPHLSGPTASLVANYLLFEVFKEVTGAGAKEMRRAVVRLELEVADSSVHTFQPHPYCGSCDLARTVDGC